MIQDIKPHQLDNQYHSGRRPEADDFVLSYQGQKILCNTAGGELRLPRVKDLAEKEELIYLFAIDGCERHHRNTSRTCFRHKIREASF